MTKLESVLDELLGVLRPEVPKAPVRDFRTYPEGESLTKQSFRDECDINVIMARYEKQGILPRLSQREPQWGDFTQVEDYHTCCNRVIEAQEAFDALPAEVRSAFDNDPGKLIAALSDPSRVDELVKLGILEERKDAQNVPTEGRDEKTEVPAAEPDDSKREVPRRA